MQQLLSGFRKGPLEARRRDEPSAVRRIGVVEGALEGRQAFTALSALFPHVLFEAIETWRPEAVGDLDILIVDADARAAGEIALKLKLSPARPRIVLILHNADVQTTRQLLRDGAADVLPHPVSEPALAVSLERLLGDLLVQPERAAASGQAVALLKAGGGVGATALGVQLGALMANEGAEVCLADLDVQFGAAALYLDLPDAITLTDILGAAGDVADTPFASALRRHGSGLRLLAAPREMTAMESVGVPQIEGLVAGLRRTFAVTLFDLPSVWTAWTHRLLSLSDRIVIVTQLSVPHVQLAKRQLQTLSTQMIDDKPIVLVCNAMSGEQAGSLSLKMAERALGRDFDVVLPEDRRTMLAAINEGVELSQVKRGTKLERAIAQLADKVGAPAAAAIAGRR